VQRDDSKPLNAAVPNALWLTPTAGTDGHFKAEVSNSGWLGEMAATDREVLTLSAWIYITPGALSAGGSLTAQLIDQHSHLVLASAELADKSFKEGQWAKINTTLTTGIAGSDSVLFVVRAVSATKSVHPVGITVVSLFPTTFLNRPNGLRTDVAVWLNESGPAFIRLPGGCYVEGKDLTNSWDWKKTTGPIEQRPGHMNDVWGYWSDDGLGMAELLRMADDVGAVPLLVVNAGCSTSGCVNGAHALAPYMQDALDAVEYATGPATSEWGAKRAAAGRVEPYKLQALGIGNENCMTKSPDGKAKGVQYAENYLAIAKAVRGKYPSLLLVIGCESQSQIQAVLKMQPKIIEYANIYDVHQRKDPAQFLAAAHEFDDYDRSLPKVFVSEYSSPRKLFPNATSLGAAVAEAVYMAGMEANGDVVQLATYGDLMARPDDKHGSAGTSTILINAVTSYGSPSWVVQKLFMQHQPAALVPGTLKLNDATIVQQCESWMNGGTCDLSNLTGSAAMVAASTSVSSSGELQVKIINYGEQSVSITLQLQGGKQLTSGVLSWITGDGGDTLNTFDHPRRVAIQQKPVAVGANNQLVLDLPKWSASAVALH
jgi:alpha-N-arabinofuranosidase